MDLHIILQMMQHWGQDSGTPWGKKTAEVGFRHPASHFSASFRYYKINTGQFRVFIPFSFAVRVCLG